MSNAQLKLKKAQPERLRSLGLDEAWLQDQIARDPSLLGFGELDVIKKEKKQRTGGRIDFVMADPVFGLSRIREGKMRPLAISTGQRIKSLPDIPTMQEAGIAGVDMNLWWVTAAPAGTPQPIIDKLNGWFTEIAKMDETREFLAKNGAEPFTASPAETTKLINKEIADWANYVKLAKIEAQ